MPVTAGLAFSATQASDEQLLESDCAAAAALSGYAAAAVLSGCSAAAALSGKLQPAVAPKMHPLTLSSAPAYPYP